MDLIQDIDLWGNMDNFIGTVDPENPFCGKSPRKDGLLDEIVDGAWYRKMYDECKTIAGDEFFWFWVLLCIVTKLVWMCTNVQVWNLFLLDLPFLIMNVNKNQRLGVFLVI